MTIALATRKAFIATLVVPVIALTALSAESFAGLSGAEAQQAAGAGNNGRGNNGGNAGGGNNAGGGTNAGGGNVGGGGQGEKPFLLMRGDCIPGTNICPPPPRRKIPTPRKIIKAEMNDCSCEVNYRIINGDRVAVKDCYIEIGEVMRYCRRDAIVLR